MFALLAFMVGKIQRVELTIPINVIENRRLFRTLDEFVFYRSQKSDPQACREILIYLKEYFMYTIQYKQLLNESEIDKYLLNWNVSNVAGGIMFHELNPETKIINYTILYNNTDTYTLIELNNAISASIHEYLRVNSDIFSNSFWKRIPQTDQTNLLFIQTGVFLLSLGLSNLITLFTQNLVEEKEKLIKDQLMIVT